MINSVTVHNRKFLLLCARMVWWYLHFYPSHRHGLVDRYTGIQCTKNYLKFMHTILSSWCLPHASPEGEYSFWLLSAYYQFEHSDLIMIVTRSTYPPQWLTCTCIFSRLEWHFSDTYLEFMLVFLCGKFRNIAYKRCVAVLWNIHLLATVLELH